ncbi:Dbl homology domain-containing protein [Hyaloraphidium curvatum]|nr:Dbl homology domain-containing protein [Hyaloraphidium curvatum]
MAFAAYEFGTAGQPRPFDFQPPTGAPALSHVPSPTKRRPGAELLPPVRSSSLPFHRDATLCDLPPLHGRLYPGCDDAEAHAVAPGKRARPDSLLEIRIPAQQRPPAPSATDSMMTCAASWTDLQEPETPSTAATFSSPVDELVCTEQTYFSDLERLSAELDKLAARWEGLQGEAGPGSCLAQILSLHHALAVDLRLNSNDYGRIAHAFSSRAPQFELYNEYILNIPRLQQQVLAAAAAGYVDSAFAGLDPTQKLPLSEWLVKPFQRLTKYPLMLQRIIDTLPPSHFALPHLDAICRQFVAQLQLVNSRMEPEDRGLGRLFKLPRVRKTPGGPMSPGPATPKKKMQILQIFSPSGGTKRKAQEADLRMSRDVDDMLNQESVGMEVDSVRSPGWASQGWASEPQTPVDDSQRPPHKKQRRFMGGLFSRAM